MSRRFSQQYADARGVIIEKPVVGILLAAGTTVPADASAGYAPGCIFIDENASQGAQFFINEGSVTSADFNVFALGGVNLSTLTATATELNRLDDDNAVLATTGGTAITGSAETYKTSVFKFGSVYYTVILLDITGLDAIATDGDIIGKSTNAAHLGQITAARNGTIAALRMTCLEVPAAASLDIDLYSAAEATGKLDDAVSGLTETALITAGGNWANGTVKGGTGLPAANEYLYLTNGAGANAGTYTGGKFLIELYGA